MNPGKQLERSLLDTLLPMILLWGPRFEGLVHRQIASENQEQRPHDKRNASTPLQNWDQHGTLGQATFDRAVGFLYMPTDKESKGSSNTLGQ